MKRLISLISVFTLVTGLIIAQTGCSGKTVSAVSKTGYYFDTVCQIDIYDMEDMSEEAAGELIDEAFDLCDEFDALLSHSYEICEDCELVIIHIRKGKRF